MESYDKLQLSSKRIDYFLEASSDEFIIVVFAVAQVVEYTDQKYQYFFVAAAFLSLSLSLSFDQSFFSKFWF